MAITFVGSEEGSVTNGGTPSVTLSGLSLAENDVVIAFCCTSAGTQATPSGWTHISDRSIATGDGTLNWLLCLKVMGASPDSSVSFWDSGGSGDSGTAIAAGFRGVDTSSPLDVEFNIGLHREEAASTRPPIPAITPVNDNCCIVLCGGSSGLDTNVGSPSIGTHTLAEQNTSDDSADTTIAMSYVILSGGGGSEHDAGTWSSWSSAAGVSIGTVIALRPIGSGGQPFYSRDIISIPSGGISII